MTTFRERIDKNMESYTHLELDEGDFTMGALVSAIMEIDDEAEAKLFYDGYVVYQTNYPGTTLGDYPAEKVVKSNIGWCFGEGMKPELRDMWVRLCGASHPVFGTTVPSPQEALEAGIRLGEVNN